MSLHGFLLDFVVVLAATVVVLLIGARLRLPSVVGLLLTGILIGPSGLGAVREPEVIEGFAEVGVVLLLFTIGLEFSIERLRRLGRAFLVGGSLQTGGTIALVALAAILAAVPVRLAVFYGMLAALSSSAIVLKLYADRREIDTPHGQVTVGMLLFQDVLIVPAVLVTPLLAGTAGESPMRLAIRLAVGLSVIAGTFLLARFAARPLLNAVAGTRSRELFVLGALFACLGMALATEALGFSLALGAFLAGVLISESEYSHQAVADIGPFRDVFASLFFVSIGMLLRVETALAAPVVVVGLTLGVILVKFLVAGGAAAALGFPVRTAALVGVGIAHVGEFSFVLASVGAAEGLLEALPYQVFLATAILTMMAAPLLTGVGDPVSRRMQVLAEKWGGRPVPAEEPGGGLSEHVVLAGFGEGGRILARVLGSVHIPFVAVELNAEIVRSAQAGGVPIVYGDATRQDVLEALRIRSASLAVHQISDPLASLRSVRLCREMAPDLFLLVRTRQVAGIEALYDAGASEVVAEEFESSIELFMRVLERYHVPTHVIEAEAKVLRQDHYQRLQGSTAPGRISQAVMDILAQGTTTTVYVGSGTLAAGRSIRELELRPRSGATVIAVVRDGRATTNPSPETRVESGDALVLVGSHVELRKAVELLEAEPD